MKNHNSTKIQKNKKGQIAGQIFIYIMTVIVVGVIVLIGYSAIKNSIVKSCQVEQITFKGKIEGFVDRYSSSGSLKKEIISAPCNYQAVCFVDAAAVAAGGDINACSNTIIKSSVADKDRVNIFVISNKKTVPVGYSDLISTQPGNCTCINQQSDNFYITFKGRGSKTFIEGTN